MKGIDILEKELLAMLDNINRIKENKDKYKHDEFKPTCSALVTEFKHRIATLKQILTLVSTLRTKHIFEND